jgi:hypothetical protein
MMAILWKRLDHGGRLWRHPFKVEEHVDYGHVTYQVLASV